MTQTNPQGAPEAPTAAQIIARFEREDGYRIEGAVPREWALDAYNELRRLAALVEAQQPAPSAAARFDEQGFRDWVRRNMPDDTIIGSSAWWADHLTKWAKAFANAAPQPSPTPQADSAPADPLQAFDSPRAKALMRAWEEGWEACRDAEYVGEEAQNDAFNSSHTLTLCIAEDQQLPAPQADSQPAPATWLTDPAPTPEREFAEWLNERRGFPVSAVFHEIMRKFAARAQAADSVLEDVARLDFLATAPEGCVRMDSIGGLCPSYIYWGTSDYYSNAGRNDSGNFIGPTPRAAIDAAMKAGGAT